MLTGAYLLGNSVIHRAAPGAKVLVLAVGTLALFLRPGPVPAAVAAAMLLVAYAVARVPAPIAWAQVRPLRLFLALLFPYQMWTAGWLAAVVTCANLVIAVAAASLVTLTTTVPAMLDAAVAAAARLRWAGVDPERLGLTLALTVRSIPVVSRLAEQTRQARSARGLDRSVRAFATPLVVRTIRHAQRVGDALVARGLDDPP